jgi:hypothetical protein
VICGVASSCGATASPCPTNDREDVASRAAPGVARNLEPAAGLDQGRVALFEVLDHIRLDAQLVAGLERAVADARRLALVGGQAQQRDRAGRQKPDHRSLAIGRDRDAAGLGHELDTPCDRELAIA